MKVFRFRPLAFFVIAVVFVGCGEYNKILKSTDNEFKYNAAIKYYNNGEYARSTPLFESLSIPFNGTTRDDTVNFYEAKGYYMLGDRVAADSYLSQFCRVFGRSGFVEEAYHLKAVNLYDMSLRSELDQSNTLNALIAINEFRTLYPQSEFWKDDKDIENELKNRIEEKSYLSAKLYYLIEDYKAAVIALRNSVKDYPDSEYKEELMFLALKSSYLYAKKSVRRKQAERYIAAIDEYYNFLSEFPASKYLAEAENIYNDALSYTNKHDLTAIQQDDKE